MAIEEKTKKTLLGAISLNARALRDSRLTLDNLIRRAAERGIPQSEVAAAAGVSQAHVSRTLAAGRKTNAARKATSRPKRAPSRGTV